MRLFFYTIAFSALTAITGQRRRRHQEPVPCPALKRYTVVE